MNSCFRKKYTFPRQISLLIFFYLFVFTCCINSIPGFVLRSDLFFPFKDSIDRAVLVSGTYSWYYCSLEWFVVRLQYITPNAFIIQTTFMYISKYVSIIILWMALTNISSLCYGFHQPTFLLFHRYVLIEWYLKLISKDLEFTKTISYSIQEGVRIP